MAASVWFALVLVMAFVLVVLVPNQADAFQNNSSWALAALSDRRRLVSCHSIADSALDSVEADQWDLGPWTLLVTSTAAYQASVQDHH